MKETFEIEKWREIEDMDVKVSDVKISFCGSYLIRFIFLRLFQRELCANSMEHS